MESAVAQPKVPIVMERVHKVNQGVECGHGHVGEGQVDYEVVGDGPHASVSEDDPDHGDVPGHRDQDYQRVGNGPESHL